MVVYGCFLWIVLAKQASFLPAFGFYQETYFPTVVIFTALWMISFDVPLRIGLNSWTKY